ncbi:5645_t:CDS:2 [Funneliformis geosporum]|uniref:16289_t:CDS:1 n=1 Tax=Funneliformis geosporum TaxID=1117311 RepID=A0A9W4SLN9_9GLOM|nr:5645_t:CDS:2 [Funneliformis geosporum]CAI2173171.1 16289_t:CDS:2 [Funneliformis geosporum]
MRLHLCVAIIITCALLTINTNAYKNDLVEPIDKPFVEKYKSKELDFLTFGDWGYAKVKVNQEVGNQTKVANVMMKWGESYHGKYGNITAQIDYSLNIDSRFFFPSAFFVRESYFGRSFETKVAWIHIDTNFFYYNSTDLDDPERLNMKHNFEKFGWNGHHPLIGKCVEHFQMKRLRLLFEKYRVAAYFAGHNHVLELETTKSNQPVTYFTSGAGSRTDVGCEGKDWGMPEGTLGFLHSILKDDEMLYEFIDTTTSDFKVVNKGKVLPRAM